jgi:hypothetical protein
METNVTIIHGTARPQDLIPCFLGVLEHVHPSAYAQIITGDWIPAYAMEDDSAEWWDGDDCAAILEDLFQTLSEHAPEGTYFGSHPGDGSDYGFWSVELLD